ncbi:unnamed protein product [Adineta ricciae]|uniref:Uncharacterized protein n=1 Tax=Adineta ricciae TaxID=249248 RepID=A0A814CGP7_ADIRI|nr:unnamed protein product [Adineta ricciae]
MTKKNYCFNYGNSSDYKKYSEHIRREPDIPLSIRKIYKLLDERKAYRRISDYFHRTRRTKKSQTSRANDHDKVYRTSIRQSSSEPESMCTMQIVNDMDDDDDGDNQHLHQLSDNSPMLHDNEETCEANPTHESDSHHIQPSSSISPNHHRSSTSTQPNLLLVRLNLQKAIQELDRAIVAKSDNTIDDYSYRQEQQYSSISKIELLANGQSNLDAIVRSLSHVVTQQQENAHSILQESSTLVLNETNHVEKQSLQHVIDRLNALVDRGHSIYGRIESILSEF